ncbi:MAG: electron transport complex subunit RsxC [Proteobacteria bacterium]|nr:electron transport complex subunit RsxC [Pseudomonadota bacterium]
MMFGLAKKFDGGLKLPPNKHGAEAPSRILPIPESLTYYLTKNIKETHQCIVNIGETVLFGQSIARGLGHQPDIHAAYGGVIEAIGSKAGPYDAPEEQAVIIRTSEYKNVYKHDDKIKNKSDLLKSMGVAGMGGAAFPTGEKVQAAGAPRVWLINGVECEPMLSCDQCLMREQADKLVQAIRYLAAEIMPGRVILALESDKADAVSAMRLALGDVTDIELACLPPRYPQGGEKQLIQTLLGLEVPSGTHAAHLGILVLNVATVMAAFDALAYHLPLTHRLVTVAGQGVSAPGNVWVPIGAALKDVLDFCGYDGAATLRVTVGGPMMGRAVNSLDVAVTKGTSAILALTAADELAVYSAQPCIRCGVCTEVCPARLQPEDMYFNIRAGRLNRTRETGLMDCIACGACAYVCPSEIPLVASFLYAQQICRIEDEQKARAAYIGDLVKARDARLAARRSVRMGKSASREAAARTVDPAAMEKVDAAREKARSKIDK